MPVSEKDGSTEKKCGNGTCIKNTKTTMSCGLYIFVSDEHVVFTLVIRLLKDSDWRSGTKKLDLAMQKPQAAEGTGDDGTVVKSKTYI